MNDAAVLQEIKNKLNQHPHIKHSVNEKEFAVTVSAADPQGFPVEIVIEPDEATVWFAGYHEHISNFEEALALFGLGFFNCTRLKVSSRGKVDYRYELEMKGPDGEWISQGILKYINWCFWQKTTVRYLQNNFFPLDKLDEFWNPKLKNKIR